MSLAERPGKLKCVGTAQCGFGVVRIVSGLSVFFKMFAKHTFSFPCASVFYISDIQSCRQFLLFGLPHFFCVSKCV